MPLLLRSLTSSNRYSNHVVDKCKNKINPDPLDSLFRQVNAAYNVQQVVLWIT